MAYREAAAELLLAGARERSALVEAVFTGGIPDRDTVWEAAKLLRLPWEGVFVVVAVEAPGLAQEGLPDAEAFLAGRGDRLGLAAAPRHPDGRGVPAARRRAPVLVELLQRGVRARCGVSPTFPALGDTPRAVHYARLVLASLPAGAPAVAQFEETPLTCSPPPPRTRPGRWCARCSDRCSTCPTRSVPACWAPCGRGSTPAAGAAETGKRIYVPQHRPVPAAALQEHTGRSLDDPGPWPSCWPPWTPSGSCRAGPACRRCRRGQPSGADAVRPAIVPGHVTADAGSQPPTCGGDDGEPGPEPGRSQGHVPGPGRGAARRAGPHLRRARRAVGPGGGLLAARGVAPGDQVS